ncbi:MAG: hypothetical protein Q4C22_06020 [Bacillota bacterium]|nr:hypothetical protein [Bacillota bacterium]
MGERPEACSLREEAPPDVLGLELKDAEALLKERRLAYRTEKTASPRGSGEEVPGTVRVVRQRETPEGLLLTVCMAPDAFRE